MIFRLLPDFPLPAGSPPSRQFTPTAHESRPTRGPSVRQAHPGQGTQLFRARPDFSLGVWLLLAITIFGLFFAALFAVLAWMANGLMVAHLRSEAIRVDENQLPKLHAAFREICVRLGLPRVPALYVVQGGGALNAFAARHAGRDFVVVFSDYLEALGADTPEMKFVLGHEIGHVKSKHILKQILLAPGLLLPLLGPAYRRACESSCDRHGAYAAGDLDRALQAVLILTGGREPGREIHAAAFAGQHQQERGFFVSLHELISTYPTLSKRASDLLALKSEAPAPRPARHPLAYLPALLVPGGQTAVPANALIVLVIIGLLAAMAIPAFEKVRQTSVALTCLNNMRMYAVAADQYALENGRAPARPAWLDRTNTSTPRRCARPAAPTPSPMTRPPVRSSPACVHGTQAALREKVRGIRRSP